MSTLKLTPESELIAQTIPFGRENAVRRDTLATMLGTSDRQMRKMLQAAREEGVIILNAQDGRGYYQSADIDEMTAQYRQDTARAMSILQRRKALRKILKEAGVQV